MVIENLWTEIEVNEFYAQMKEVDNEKVKALKMPKKLLKLKQEIIMLHVLNPKSIQKKK